MVSKSTYTMCECYLRGNRSIPSSAILSDHISQEVIGYIYGNRLRNTDFTVCKEYLVFVVLCTFQVAL